MNIGDGCNTLLWHDPQVLGVLGFRVVRPSHYPLYVNQAADLMDQHCLDQKRQLLHHLFPLAQTHTILSILA